MLECENHFFKMLYLTTPFISAGYDDVYGYGGTPGYGSYGGYDPYGYTPDPYAYGYGAPPVGMRGGRGGGMGVRFRELLLISLRG